MGLILCLLQDGRVPDESCHTRERRHWAALQALTAGLRVAILWLVTKYSLIHLDMGTVQSGALCRPCGTS